MEIKEFLNGLEELKEDSDTLAEIKKVMHNDGTITIVEQITHLQENTSVTNVNSLLERLNKLENMINNIESDFSSQSDDVGNAMGYLESVSEESDSIYDARQMIDDLRTDLNTDDSELYKDEDTTTQPTAN